MACCFATVAPPPISGAGTRLVPNGRGDDVRTTPAVITLFLRAADKPCPDRQSQCAHAPQRRRSAVGGDGVRRFAVVGVAVQIRGGSAIFDSLTSQLAWLCRLSKCPGRTPGHMIGARPWKGRLARRWLLFLALAHWALNQA